jgi:hypothetical protein
LALHPCPTRLRWLHDVFDNSMAIATVDGSTTALRFDSVITLEEGVAKVLMCDDRYRHERHRNTRMITFHRITWWSGHYSSKTS